MQDLYVDVSATDALTIYVILLDLGHPSGSNRNCVIQQGSTGGVEKRADVEHGRRCLPLAADSAALCTRFTPISACRAPQSTVPVNHTVSAFKKSSRKCLTNKEYNHYILYFIRHATSATDSCGVAYIYSLPQH
jgi:hypothetical protein